MKMKRWLTTSKLIIVLLAIGAVSFTLHAVSKGTPTVDIGLDMVNTPIENVDVAAWYAPSVDVAPEQVRDWLGLLRAENDGSPIFAKGIANLEALLAAMTPQQPALLPNYPNPFNPETWIPYQLVVAADITIDIYATDGKRVRHLAIGHQAAGVYQSKGRAAYWDGRNDAGERVASGVYLYTLTAGDFSATKKMLIRK